ncbi:nicolin-1-like [Hyalella azteca]|uniref:Nicolin-1-like n=1 Tax=Hyalella azteca TaxID=294128 RepID=A0A979FPL0_HYAAZ|nr:nicolin-1-like [Hyalella azteca]
MAREVLKFQASGPHPVTADDAALSPRSGCMVITLAFPRPTQIGEITFRNYYTWAVGVHVLRANVGGATNKSTSKGGVTGSGLMGAGIGLLKGEGGEWRDPTAWQVGVANKVIMPHPHTETASHAFISITCLESRVEWQEVLGLRLVLRQPSPVWRTFSVDDITAYRELPRLPTFSVSVLPQHQQALQAQETPLERLIRQTDNALRTPPPRAPGARQDEPTSLVGNYDITSLQYA